MFQGSTYIYLQFPFPNVFPQFVEDRNSVLTTSLIYRSHGISPSGVPRFTLPSLIEAEVATFSALDYMADDGDTFFSAVEACNLLSRCLASIVFESRFSSVVLNLTSTASWFVFAAFSNLTRTFPFSDRYTTFAKSCRRSSTLKRFTLCVITPGMSC